MILKLQKLEKRTSMSANFLIILHKLHNFNNECSPVLLLLTLCFLCMIDALQ